MHNGIERHFLTVEEWPRPTPGSECLFACCAGICGSDVHAASHLEAMMAETGPTSGTQRWIWRRAWSWATSSLPRSSRLA